MLKSLFLLVVLAAAAFAQQAEAPAQQGQPPVHVNIINVCNPAPAEQKEIAAALARVPRQPSFQVDFEVDRGRSTVPDGPVASWVRVRRDLSAASPISTVQYSFSVDDKATVETLVFQARDPKDFLQIALDDRISAGSSPAEVLASDTPVTHLKIERFGKASLGLARCEADQTAYEPLFRAASDLMSRYRALLNVRRTVPADLRMLGIGKPAAPAHKAPAKKPAKPSQ